MPRTNPSYTAEFRQQAVELLLSSGRPLIRVAKDLAFAPPLLPMGAMPFCGMAKVRCPLSRRQKDAQLHPLRIRSPRFVVSSAKSNTFAANAKS